MTTIINSSLEKELFPDELKIADAPFIWKKDEDFNKGNCEPVIILSHMSKVFKSLLYKQTDNFMTSKFLPYLCGFRENYNSQHSLLKIMEFWKKYLDKEDFIGVILMDLSEAFDIINQGLLKVKLKAYGILITLPGLCKITCVSDFKKLL